MRQPPSGCGHSCFRDQAGGRPISGSNQQSVGGFARRALVVLALAAAFLLAWKLRRIELLLFGSILFAVMFDAAARGLTRWLRLGRGWALALAATLFALFLTAAFAFFGFRFQAQVAQLIHSLPPAWAHFRQTLAGAPLGAAILKPLDQLVSGTHPSLGDHLRGFAVSTGAALGALVLMIMAGIYLAAQPGAYLRGLLRLVPPSHRDRASDFLAVSGAMLRRWLWVQAAAMAAVGLLVGLGLWIIGVPAAAALGLLAGLGEFVPLMGVLIASTPTLLLALTQGWSTVAWTLALLVAVHQFEGDILQPLLQRGLASVPPVVTLFALVGFGELFGLMGVFFAVPLAIVCMAAIQVFYPQPEPPRAPDEKGARRRPRRR